MEKKLVMSLGENKIVAEIYPTEFEDVPYELCVYLCDKEDRITQDICLVRPHFDYNRKSGLWEGDNNFVDCLVWGESGNEDYSDKHVIGVYEWEEDE